MNRLALRMLTKGLLLAGPQRTDSSGNIAAPGKVGVAPFATMALDRVFDSMRTSFADITDIPEPAIVVKTGLDHRRKTGTSGFWSGGRAIELTIEFGIWVKDDDGPGYPALDPRLESRLDLFEYQIESALRGTHPWVAVWQQYFNAQEMLSDHVWVDNEEFGRVPVAARRITIPTTVQADCIPPARRYDEETPVPDLPKAFDAIIQQLKRESDGDFLTYVEGIEELLMAEALPEGSSYPRLRTVWARFLQNNPPGNDPPEQLTEGDWLDEPEV